jgi:mannose-6-phosphate isomerase-like protein (cupin superfamily)
MSAVGAGAYVLEPGEGRPIDLGGFSITVKATAEGTDGTFTLLEAAEPPHFGPPLHIHHGIAEAFYVLEGEYIIFVDGEEFRCPAGSFIFIPAETPHGFVVGDGASRKLNLYLPASMVGYFDDLSDAMKKGTADEEELAKIASRYSLEVIGPVPEGYL